MNTSFVDKVCVLFQNFGNQNLSAQPLEKFTVNYYSCLFIYFTESLITLSNLYIDGPLLYFWSRADPISGMFLLINVWKCTCSAQNPICYTYYNAISFSELFNSVCRM